MTFFLGPFRRDQRILNLDNHKNYSGKITPTFNARVGAVAIFIGGIGIGTLSLLPEKFAPLSLLSLGISVFGCWALSDEMGTEKPLIRGAMVAFVFAAAAKSQALLLLDAALIARFYIFYAFTILVALLLWSAAFLHRQKELKIIGAVGALATVVPIVMLLLGHVVVGVGGVFGLTALFSVAEGGTQIKFAAIDSIDLIFAVWAIVAGFVLWGGHIRKSV